MYTPSSAPVVVLEMMGHGYLGVWSSLLHQTRLPITTAYSGMSTSASPATLVPFMTLWEATVVKFSAVDRAWIGRTGVTSDTTELMEPNTVTLMVHDRGCTPRASKVRFSVTAPTLAPSGVKDRLTGEYLVDETQSVGHI